MVEACSSNPYAPIQWRSFATLPPNQFLGAIEWHNGCLYAFGACDVTSTPDNPGTLFFDCFRVFREATDLWEDLPPIHIVQAVPHQGRLVVFLDNCTAFARAADGSWSRCEVAEGTMVRNNGCQFVAASVLLG